MMNFSVVIPAHNAEPFIESAVRSALAQDRECEVIVIADRCSDATAQRARDAGARVIECSFGSAGDARNLGLKSSERSHIAFLDADDRFEAGWLSACEHAFTESKAALVYSTPSFIYRYNDAPEGAPQNPDVELCALAKPLLYRNVITTSACAVRRDAILDVGAFRPQFKNACEDLDLWLRIAECYPCAFIPGTFVSYWLRPGSAVRDVNALVGFRDAHLRVINEAFERQQSSVAYRRRCVANAYLQSATRFLSQGHHAAAREIDMARQFGAPAKKFAPLMLLSKSPKALTQKLIALRRSIKKRR